MQTRQPKKSYKQTIHDYLLAGHTLSTYEAFNLWQITCFLQRVSELRAQGVVIQDKTIKRNGKTFKEYWIDKPANNNARGVQI
ncbi:helix-turn-helix domain-containing protein [Psychrobacter sp. DD43]|uniref:helix-turn-helix domain-containing protein n=1 Tax=Psychrobacter sp. DD43 TaxID=2774128 RepID=UPI001918AF03|nr:helix-turn-helix domain-containing protein [Psychrobacter sp. DD43]